MKKYIFCVLSVLMIAGCKSDFIKLAPITSTSTENFYKTSNDMMNALTAVYSSLQGAGAAAEEFMFGDLPTDDAQSIPSLCAQGHCAFDLYNSLAVGGENINQITNHYNAAYVGIYRANIVLDKIDAVPMDAALKSRAIAEAKFLRGYYYFNLVKVFGGVPLILKALTQPEDAYQYGRESAATVFAQVEKDMTEAAAGLPATYTATTDIGRVTSGAAKGMLARVLLFEGKFAEAAALLKGIIDNQGTTQYDLLPAFADIFKATNGNNKEILFSVQYSYTANNNGIGGNPTNTFTTTNADQPTVDIYREYEAGDIRRDATVDIKNLTANSFSSSYVVKFFNATAVPGNVDTDYPVLRYADILLMYAECLNEAGATGYIQALPYINKVRQRAGLAGLQNTDASTTATFVTGQADLRTRIMHERRVEFAFEGLRFFDLVRTNNLVTVMNAYFAKYGNPLRITDKNKLFPIPQTQIDVNPGKMSQNPGY